MLRRVMSAVAFGGLLTGLWVGPVMLATRLHPRSMEAKSLWHQDDGVPAFGVVGSRVESGRQPAELDLRWGDPQVVRLQFGGGIVTAVGEPSPTSIVNGDEILSIDGQGVIAAVSATPIYREVIPGLAGDDVRWLDNLLLVKGVVATSTLDSEGASTPRMRSAVRTLQRQLRRAETDGVFRPEYSIFLSPSHDWSLDDLTLTVGQRLAVGDTIAQAAPRLLEASIHLTGPASRQHLLANRTLVASWDLATITVGGLSLAESELRIVESLADSSQPQISNVLVGLVEPIQFGSVSSGALIVAEGGEAACLAVVGPEGLTSMSAEFATSEILPAEAGLALVPVEFVGDRIVTNPSTYDGLTCG